MMLVVGLGLGSTATIWGQKCTVEAVQYKGWQAEQLANRWVKLTFVPQLGGRLMQVEFDGHPYLFVNPRFAGQTISSEQAAGKWINYGGDKIWPMPEGNDDEQHWVLESSLLDDGAYSFKTLEQSAHCTVLLEGPADPVTGLQYTRQVSIDADSPAIRFHALMHNATAHTLKWSVQSVSQYNLASAANPQTFNRDFWAYTEENPSSSYLDHFHVRDGLVNDPSFSIEGGLFRLHWMNLQNEVWVDSPGGWLAVVDGESGFGMIERFDYDSSASYPGKATVIFYKNGPSIRMNDAGNPEIAIRPQLQMPYYMEAEVNSPLVTLKPGASAAFDTTWYPVHASPQVVRVTEAGLTSSSLEAKVSAGGIHVDGIFSPVAEGHLELRVYDHGGRDTKRVTLDQVSPKSVATVHADIPLDFKPSRVALHLIASDGSDWGLLDEAKVQGGAEGK